MPFGRYGAAVLLLAAAVLLPHFSRAQETVPVRLFEDPYPPFTEGEIGKDAQGGLVVEIIREIFHRMDVPVSLELAPWKRVLKLAETGRADGVMLVMHSQERESYLALTESLFDECETLAFHKDRLAGFTWRTFSDLIPYRIGLVDGYAYNHALTEAVKELGLNVEYSSSTLANMRKLLAGRVDLIVESELVLKQHLAKYPDLRQNLVLADQRVFCFPMYMALSRKSPAMALLPRINRTIRAMKDDGTMDAILHMGE